MILRSWFGRGSFLLISLLGLNWPVRADVVIYASDFSGGRVLKIEPSKKTTLISGLSQPMATSFGPDGNLYVAQQFGQRIGRFTPAGKAVGKTFGTNRYYTGLAFGPDGQLYANATESSFQVGTVERFNPATGAAEGDGLVPNDAAGYTAKISSTYFEGLTFGPDGNVYASSHYANSILVYQGPGGANPGALVKTLPGVDKPVGLTFGPDGKLYVTEQDRARVVRWDGSSFSVFASGSRFATPIGLGFGPNGDLYVANYGGGNIAEFQGPGGTNPGTFVSIYATGIGNPGYIMVVPEPGTLAMLCTCGIGVLLRRPTGRHIRAA